MPLRFAFSLALLCGICAAQHARPLLVSGPSSSEQLGCGVKIDNVMIDSASSPATPAGDKIFTDYYVTITASLRQSLKDCAQPIPASVLIVEPVIQADPDRPTVKIWVAKPGQNPVLVETLDIKTAATQGRETANKILKELRFLQSFRF